MPVISSFFGIYVRLRRRGRTAPLVSLKGRATHHLFQATPAPLFSLPFKGRAGVGMVLLHTPNPLQRRQQTARARQNVFTALMEAVRTHSLGQISHALYDVGGEYRRNM
jgi:hypothetical protein